MSTPAPTTPESKSASQASPEARPEPAAQPHEGASATAASPPSHGRRHRWWLWGLAAGVVLLLLVAGMPWLIRTLTTVSTDDAYVNGHVTIVAPRVAGQVARVLVDDNNRVGKGDLLVELDKEPFEVEVSIAQAAVDAAQADLAATEAQVRGQEGRRAVCGSILNMPSRT